MGSVPGSLRCFGVGNGNSQYSCLENSLDRGAQWATVHGVTKSQTQWHIHQQLPTNRIEGDVLLVTSEILVIVVPVGFKHNCRKPIFIECEQKTLLGRKVMINLDSLLKSRDITLSTKVCLVKAMVFLVVMYGHESWTVKKADR